MLNGLLHANGVCRCCCGSTAVVAALEESSSASSLFSSSLSSPSPSRNRRKAETDVGDGEVSVGGGGGGGGSDRCDLSSPASSSLPSATTGGNTGATPVTGWWVILGQDRERGGDRCTSFVWSLQSSKPGRRLLSVGPGLDALFGLQRSVSKAIADDGDYDGISGKIYKGATVATVAKKNRILIWAVEKLV